MRSDSKLDTRNPKLSSGFTLVELVIVIAITGIVAAMTAVFVLRPVQGYVDLSRRAALVDSAESALRRMARDIRNALPNSVRVTDLGAAGFAVELLPTLDGARYATAEATGCENLAGFAATDTQFDILGTFSSITTPVTYTDRRLVINNQGAGTTHDVYADAVSAPAQSVITPAGASITVTTGACVNSKHNILLGAAHQFRSESPRDRLFVITTPVSYLCSPAPTGGTLTRYSGYAIQATQQTTAAALNALAGVTSAQVAGRLFACNVTTITSDVLDRGLVTITLTLSEQGEQIRLIHQVQLDNSR